MATYEYKCKNEHLQEVRRPMTAPEENVVCDTCSEPMSKVYHPAPTIFKGSGFYSTRK
jgi:putative FmdB family regulatory protein